MLDKHGLLLSSMQLLHKSVAATNGADGVLFVMIEDGFDDYNESSGSALSNGSDSVEMTSTHSQ